MARLLRLLPDTANPHKPRSVDPSKIACVSLAAMANQAKPLRGVTSSRRSKVPSGGRGWFTNRVMAHVRTPGGPTSPYATAISRRSVFPKSMRPPKPNSVEPPWYGTRMPGGVGGVASQGAPYPDQSARIADLHGRRTSSNGRSSRNGEGSRSFPTASSRSRCSSSCSARSSEPPNDGAACASRSSSSDRSPLSEKNSTTNVTLQSRRWPGQPSPEFPANPSLDPGQLSFQRDA